MKKLSLILVAVLLFGVISVGLSGCSVKEYSDGYFKYKYAYEDKNKIQISGLTDLGKQQKFLVIPTEIKGKKIMSLQNRYPLGRGSVDFTSEHLEKIYFLEEIRTLGLKIGNIKAFLVNLHPNYGGGVIALGNIQTHINTIVYDFLYEKYGSAGNKVTPANITYYVNYETDINNGIHWIDDVTYGKGGLIEFIPPNPIRNGYTFDGWYYETECINIWDFNADKLPAQVFDADEQIVYQETKLFAKWI